MLGFARTTPNGTGVFWKYVCACGHHGEAQYSDLRAKGHCPRCSVKNRRAALNPGDLVGPFRMIERVSGRVWRAECVRCGAEYTKRDFWGRAGLYRHAAIEPGVAKVHPTQKPIALMRDLIELFTDPGDLVIDLFAGGGTTLRAARDLGRLSVGVEIREDYARAAAARMGAGACGGDPSQPSLF